MFLSYIDLKLIYIILIICIYVKKKEELIIFFFIYLFFFYIFAKTIAISTIILHLLKEYSTDLASHRIELIVLHLQ